MKKFLHIALIGFFLAGIALPLLFWALGIAGVSERFEQRRLAQLPRWSWEQGKWQAYPQAFSDYYAQRFGGRSPLIVGHNLFRLSVLRDFYHWAILVGRQGQFFLQGDPVRHFRGDDLFSGQELGRWRDQFEARRQWLAERGCDYLLVIAPEAHSIYPEYLPSAYHPIASTTRAEQLYDFLQEHSEVPVLYLKAALLEEKKRGRCYYRTDGHWNDRGIFAAYREIANFLQEWSQGVIETRSRDSYREAIVPWEGGDILQLLGISRYVREPKVVWRPREEGAWDFSLERVEGELDPFFYSREDIYEKAGGEGELLFVLHDSFFLPMRPFLAQHFKRSRFFFRKPHQATHFPAALIESERPQVVVEEMVERYFMAPSLDNTTLTIGERFAAMEEVLWVSRGEGWRGNSEVVLKGVADGVGVEVLGGNPQIFWPSIAGMRGQEVAVKIELEASRAADAELFYRTISQPHFLAAQKVSAAVVPGRNVIYFLLESTELGERLRFDISKTPGEFTIYSVEVRSSRPQGHSHSEP